LADGFSSAAAISSLLQSISTRATIAALSSGRRLASARSYRSTASSPIVTSSGDAPFPGMSASSPGGRRAALEGGRADGSSPPGASRPAAHPRAAARSRRSASTSGAGHLAQGPRYRPSRAPGWQASASPAPQAGQVAGHQSIHRGLIASLSLASSRVTRRHRRRASPRPGGSVEPPLCYPLTSSTTVKGTQSYAFERPARCKNRGTRR
jgi:hypothetical protein